jgi:hypothetical protein
MTVMVNKYTPPANLIEVCRRVVISHKPECRRGRASAGQNYIQSITEGFFEVIM